MRIVVLISGRGSNLEALLKHQDNYEVLHVISNNFNAKGIETAKKHGIKNTCINWSDPSAAESTLIEVIETVKVDLIVLAGFMRILSNKVLDTFHDRIINIHPSLLPKYPGLNTHQKVIDNNDKLHGATVHLVDDQLDHGRVLAQTSFTVDSEKNVTILANQLISKEHKLLTAVMSLIGSDTLTWDHEHIYLNNKKISTPLKIN